MRPRLFLITPREPDDRMVDRVAAALSGGDVASLLIDTDPLATQRGAKLVEAMVEACRSADVAALVRNDTQLAGRAGADGVHVDTGLEDIEAAVSRFRPKRIVGAGRIANRHDALLVGDMDVDYVFFGRTDRDEQADADREGLALAEWWSPIVEIPCVAMAGRSWNSLEQACETGAEFAGVRALVWDDPDGPAEGVRKANAVLDGFDDGF